MSGRPIPPEPLAIELVNTELIGQGGMEDRLDSPDGMRAWLREVGQGRAPSDEQARAALLSARRAIRAVLEHRDDSRARRALNDVLAHGRLLERLGPGGPEQDIEVDHERWRLPWLCADNLLELLRQAPERVRRCANEECIRYFYDVSRGGKRRWCSMRGCGNRLKARRHYARQHDNSSSD